MAGKPHICFAAGTDPAYADAITQQYGYQATQVEGGEAFELAPRWAATATDGGGLSQGDPTTITWSYVPDGTSIAGFAGEPTSNSNLQAWLSSIYPGGFAQYHPVFLQFFARWSELTGISYVYEPNDDGASFGPPPGGAPGLLGVRGDVRIGAHFIDGDFNTLAYNFFPAGGGDMVIDSADSFFNDTSDNSLILRNTLAHEAGHGIGLEHSCPTNGSKLMEPFINLNFDGPQFDDILGAQRHYGDVNEDNDNAGSATAIGPLIPGDSHLESGLSIDGSLDGDFFSFQMNSQISSLSVHASPTTQAPYPAGPQDGNCETGNPTFNPNPVHDLKLEVLDSDGTTVLHSRDINPAGQPEDITDIPLTGPATYYARILGDGTNQTQLYDLALDVGASTSLCEATPTSPCKKASRSRLVIKAGKKLAWKFKGGVALGEFGNVLNADTVALCGYRDGNLIFSAGIPAAGSRWKVKPGKKLRYKDKAGLADGVTRLRIRPKGFRLKMKEQNLPFLPMALNTELQVQLRGSGGACYESEFLLPLKKNTDKLLKARQ